MTWSIPHTFIAGTKAKANEVNENFTSLKSFVDQQEVNIANNEVNVEQLKQTKADINGSVVNRFQVADASSNKDAVNLAQAKSLTENTTDVIKGFILSRYNNTTIAATAGSCYDATVTYMITSANSLSKQVDNLTANTTYYVYVTADKQTNNVQLIASLTNGTPELPIDYDFYRQLGNFVTDENSHIAEVNQVGAETKRTVGFIGNQIEEIKSTQTVTLKENRWLYVEADGDRKQIVVTVNGIRVSKFRCTKDWADAQSALIPCLKGQTVVITVNGGTGKWLKMVY